MKPYEEINFPNGFLRWIREDGMYVCSLTEEQMVKFKALHEAPRTWVGLKDDDLVACSEAQKATVVYFMNKLKELNT